MKNFLFAAAGALLLTGCVWDEDDFWDYVEPPPARPTGYVIEQPVAPPPPRRGPGDEHFPYRPPLRSGHRPGAGTEHFHARPPHTSKPKPGAGTEHFHASPGKVTKPSGSKGEKPHHPPTTVSVPSKPKVQRPSDYKAPSPSGTTTKTSTVTISRPPTGSGTRPNPDGVYRPSKSGSGVSVPRPSNPTGSRPSGSSGVSVPRPSNPTGSSDVTVSRPPASGEGRR